MLYKVKTLFYILIITTIIGCYDNVTENHFTYQDALKSNLFNRGWLPKEIILKTTTNFKLTNNLDTNKSSGSFNVNKENLQTFISLLNFNHENKIFTYSNKKYIWSFYINQTTGYTTYELQPK